MSFCCFACITEQERGIIQRLGKFDKVVEPGISIMCWPFSNVAGTVSTRLRQITLRTEAKTRENMFVTLSLSLQVRVEPENVKLAFYSMEDPSSQMKSFVEDSLRSIVPTMDLDHLFLEKIKVSAEVKDDLAKRMHSYGYSIIDALITDIEPEHNVKAAMNRINEAKRLREAAEYQADTQKLVKVREAEAEAISKKLQGEGVANQRKAILHGLQSGVEELAGAIGVTAAETMKYTMLTQYFDMLRDVGTSPNKATIFVPHAPSAVNAFADQLGQSMMGAMEGVRFPSAGKKEGGKAE